MRQFIIRFVTLLAFVAALLSCSNEYAPLVPEQENSEFTLYLLHTGTVNDGTRTVNDGYSTKWVIGDKVNVFHAETGTDNFKNDGAFTYTAEDCFTGSLKTDLKEGKSYDWYVSYPYNPAMDSPKNMRVNIPSVQTQQADDDMSHLSKDLCPLAGKVLGVPAEQNPSVMMNHLVTVMKIKVTNYEAEPCELKTVSFNHHTKKNISTVLTGAYYLDMTGNTMELIRAEDDKASLSEGDVTRPYIMLQHPKVLNLNESATVYIVCRPFTIENATLLSVGMNNTSEGVSQAMYGKSPVCKAGTINGIKQGSRKAPPFKSNVKFYHGRKNADGTYTLDHDGWWRCELPNGFDLQGVFNFKDLFTSMNSDAKFTLIDKPNQNVTVQSMYDAFKSCLDESSGQWNGNEALEVNLYFPETDRSGIFVNSSAGYNVGSWAIMYYEPNQTEEPPTVDQTSEMYDSYEGLVMAGYQGWHGTPGDGCPHPPLQPSHTPVRPAPPDPVLSPRPTAGGGGPSRTRVPGHPSPHTTTEGGGKGLRREAGRQAGKGTRPRHGRGEKRAGEPDRRPQEAWWGWGTGSGRQPRGSEGVGRRLATGAAGPERRTTDDRPRQAGPGPAAGGGGARQADPRRGAATRHAAQPARRDRRIRAARSAAVNGGKAVVACATGVRTRGGGGGGSLRSNPLTPPPNPRAHLEGRGVEGRASGRGDRTTRRGTDARRGRRRGEGRGRASRRGRTRLFPPDPHTLPRRPPTSLARGSSPPETPGSGSPSGRVRPSPPLPCSLPIPRRARVEERLASRAGRGEAPPRRSRNRPR